MSRSHHTILHLSRTRAVGPRSVEVVGVEEQEARSSERRSRGRDHLGEQWVEESRADAAGAYTTADPQSVVESDSEE